VHDITGKKERARAMKTDEGLYRATEESRLRSVEI
jgi:hypothetical protein